ncbi:MAG: DUF1700 domain-containing protein [Clostridiales bacterium]|nr:DUF1700 domain-containing protein [Clostridiales bacterium]
MKREEFIGQLENRLSGLPKDELEGRLSFYSEMIDSRMENGMTEEEAVDSFGSVDDVVEHIMSEIPLTKVVRANSSSKKGLPVWAIVLLIVGFPIWFSLLVAVFAVFLGLWIAVLSLYIVAVAFIIAAVASVVVAVYMFITGRIAIGIMLVGVTLILVSFTIVAFVVTNLLVRGMGFLTKKTVFGIKSLFIGKEGRS